MKPAFDYLSSAELTDVGRRRKNNEDSLIRLPEAGVFCVADGMGGVQGGEVASKASVDALHKEFTESPDAPFALTADASARLVERALNSASNWIKERAEGLGLNGSGSTAVALVFDRVTPSQGVALHAGDSRAYRLRDEKLVQLTVDHSVAAAAGLADDSSLPPMFRGVITRAVGLDRHVQLEATPFDVVSNDIFLLCSDGLSKMVSDRRLQKLLRKYGDGELSELARVLIEEALKEGGEDNVSVVVVRVAKELPKGPTMEIPPETLALEKLVVAEAPPPEPSHFGDEHDATGETADTGMGNRTASTMADMVTPTDSDHRQVGVTPDTPASGGNPPFKPHQRARAEVQSSSRLKWLWMVLVLSMMVGAAIWGYQEWRTSRTGVVPEPREAGSEIHDGAQRE